VRAYEAIDGLMTDYGRPQEIGSLHSLFAPEIRGLGPLNIQFGNNFDVGIGKLNFDEIAATQATISIVLWALYLAAVAPLGEKR
jgi:hypothetical protein